MDKRIKDIITGQKSRISFRTSSKIPVELECTIKRIDKDRIFLDFPKVLKNYTQYLNEGKELGVLIYTENGIRISDSIVLDPPLSEELVIEYPDNFNTIQRREYVRVPMRLELILNKKNRKIRTQTINISGGGIRFTLNNEIGLNEIWSFILYLPGAREPARAEGEILYVIKQDYKIFGVIRFSDISIQERDKLIRLCFEEELKRLKYS